MTKPRNLSSLRDRLSSLRDRWSILRDRWSFPIGYHYNVLMPAWKICPTILFKLSQHMTDPLRHLLCEIREHVLPTFRTNCFNAGHPCISAIPGFPNKSTSCLMAIVSLRKRYANRHMALFQSSDASVHKNITSTHSFTQFLLLQIHPNCTITVLLGTIYLTVIRALIDSARTRFNKI